MKDPLQQLWVSQDSGKNEENINMIVQRILDEDRAGQVRSGRCALVAVGWGGLAVLLLGAAVTGKTSAVRAGYGMASIGMALALYEFLMMASLANRALPGPEDSQSQLRKIGYLLGQRNSLAKAAPWVSLLIFGGVALIGYWSFFERSVPGAYLLWTLAVAAWLGVWHRSTSTVRELHAKKREIEDVLAEWQSR